MALYLIDYRETSPHADFRVVHRGVLFGESQTELTRYITQRWGKHRLAVSKHTLVPSVQLLDNLFNLIRADGIPVKPVSFAAKMASKKANVESSAQLKFAGF